MKKFLTLALLLVALGFGFWLLGTDYDDLTNYPPKGDKVLAFGDSLVLGVGTTPGNDFVSRVSRDLGVPIINSGRSGDTTADGLRRINSALAQRPDVVLVLLGGNDALRRVPITETEANLEEILNKFQEVGAVTVLVGVRGGIASDPYYKMYRRVAERTGSMLITDVLRGIMGDRRYMADLVHPNDAGHEVIARRVTVQLKELFDNNTN